MKAIGSQPVFFLQVRQHIHILDRHLKASPSLSAWEKYTSLKCVLIQIWKKDSCWYGITWWAVISTEGKPFPPKDSSVSINLAVFPFFQGYQDVLPVRQVLDLRGNEKRMIASSGRWVSALFRVTCWLAAWQASRQKSGLVLIPTWGNFSRLLLPHLLCLRRKLPLPPLLPFLLSHSYSLPLSWLATNHLVKM